MLKIIDSKEKKIGISPSYNFVFDKKTGYFARWGKTKDEDPSFSPFGPEILDLEISEGKCLGKCKFCYKENGADANTHHLTLEEFKTIFHKMPKTLTQIAFGICDVDSNPDFFAMMEYAKENGVIPNYTCNGIGVTEEIAEQTAKLCGAVAVSLVNKEKSYETIRKFLKKGMTQVNMHFMLSEETYEKAFKVVEEISSDPSMKGFNAIVFLQYKPKGKYPNSFHSVLDVTKYQNLMRHCEEHKINYGFDSCSAPMFMKSIMGRKDEKQLEMMAEPCESGMFSSYINCHGEFFVCSFAEGEDTWKEGIDVLHCEDFLKDVWWNSRLVKWRERLGKNNRECPIYNLKAKNFDKFVTKIDNIVQEFSNEIENIIK